MPPFPRHLTILMPSYLTLDKHQKELAKLLQANCSRRHLHDVFRDFCELAALAISNSVDRSQWDKREARYLKIVSAYERAEVMRFCEMLTALTNRRAQ